MIESAIEQARKCDSLILGEGIFSEKSLSGINEEEMRGQKSNLSNYLVKNLSPELCSIYHRFYFTYPLKMAEKEGNECKGVVKGIKGMLNNTLYDIEPIFNEMELNFDSQFKVLDDAFKTISQLDSKLLNKYQSDISHIFSMRSNMDEDAEKFDIRYGFQLLILNPCEYLLNSLVDVKFHRKKKLFYDKSILYPDILIENANTSTNLLLIEIKSSGLEQFIEENKLLESDSNFNSMIKQMSTYLIASDLEIGLISDFRVTIMIKPNLKKVTEKNLRHIYPVEVKTEFETLESEYEEETEEKKPKLKIVKYVKVPFEYKIIRNTDCGITLQALIASLLYNECNKLPNRSAKRKRQVLRPQAKYLQQVLTMSAEDQRESILANSETQIELDHVTNRSSKYKGVDKSKFFEIVKIHMKSNKDLIPIQKGYKYFSQVYLFPYKKYWKYFQNRGVSDGVPDTVVLKMYEFTQLGNYTREYREDLRCNYLNDEYSVEDTYNRAARLMLNEISCYQQINKSKHKFRVPELYDYGTVITHVKGYPVLSGYFLLMSYMESNQEDKKLAKLIYTAEKEGYDSVSNEDLEQVLKVSKTGDNQTKRKRLIKKLEQKIDVINKDLREQLRLLRKIGVAHNDVGSRNLVFSKGKYSIIDFSHGKVFEPEPGPELESGSSEGEGEEA